MGRRPCCSKEESLNRGAWTAAEDKILTDYIKIHGEGKWNYLPKRAGLKRCGKSCRLRWMNYLRPDIKRGNISHDEEELIIRLHKLLGNRWSLIAGRLPGRTDNEIKNYWNTNIGKKLKDQCIPSSSTRNILSQRQEKPKFGDKKSIAETDSYPIQTRASRCTRVFLSAPEQQTKAAPALSIANGSGDDVDQNVKGAGSLPEFNVEENDPFDCMIDFEMDDNFLSLINTEFSQLPSFDDAIGGDNSTGNTCDKGYSSQNSDETLFLSDYKLQDSDFALMDELIGSEF